MQPFPLYTHTDGSAYFLFALPQLKSLTPEGIEQNTLSAIDENGKTHTITLPVYQNMHMRICTLKGEVESGKIIKHDIAEHDINGPYRCEISIEPGAGFYWCMGVLYPRTE